MISVVNLFFPFDVLNKFPFLDSGYWESAGPWWDYKLYPITTAPSWGMDAIFGRFDADLEKFISIHK